MHFLPQFFSYYSDDYTTTSQTTADGAAILIMLLVFIVILALAYVISALLLARVFKKASIEPWKAWVPVYNSWTLLEMGGQKGFWSILMFIPFVNVAASVFMYIAFYHIGLRFGKSGEFVLWAIFLPIVWLIWLAFDKSIWTGPGSASPQQQTPPAFVPPAQ